MLNDREMESGSIVVLALELNTFGRRRRNTCDYKLRDEKKQKENLIEIHGRAVRGLTCAELWLVAQIAAVIDAVAVFVERQAQAAPLARELGYFA
jgi:hypothetical protein